MMEQLMEWLKFNLKPSSIYSQEEGFMCGILNPLNKYEVKLSFYCQKKEEQKEEQKKKESDLKAAGVAKGTSCEYTPINVLLYL